MLILSLALRNVFRHRVRSTVALSAIAFSVIVLMLAGGFVQWIFWAMREAATTTGLGHVQVMRKGFLENGTADPYAYLLPKESSVLSSIEKDVHVKGVAQRLNFNGLVSYGDSTLSFVGTGVDPRSEAVVSAALPLVGGENLEERDDAAVVLGVGLASNLGVPIGAKVVLLVNTARGGVAAVEATVKGFYSSQVKAIDDVSLRVPLSTARRLMKVSGSHVWVVKLDSVDEADPTRDAFAARFTDAKLEFHTWSELADFYTKTVRLLSSQMNVVRMMIGAIIVLGISNMLVMNVLERTGEVGTLMALGGRRRRIVQLFLSEGALLGLVGGAVGLLLGLLLAHVISIIGIPMPPPPGRNTGYDARILIQSSLAFETFGLAVVATLIASLYPSWKASRLVIVDALRQNR